MADDAAPVMLAGVSLGRSRHVCAFFDDKDQEIDVLLPFVREGLEAGEKAIHVVDPDLRDSHLDRLRRGGIDVEAAQQRGQLEVKTTDEVYFPDGDFHPDVTMALYEDMLKRARSEGYPLTRLIAAAPRVVAERHDKNAFLEYEARLNGRFHDYEDPIICTYDGTSFDGRTIVGVLRTHPVAMVGSGPVENPFFAPPAQFLEELRRSKGGRPRRN
jgi:hypothetical protein